VAIALELEVLKAARRFEEPNFLYGTDILRSVDIHRVTLTFNLLTSNVYVSHVALRTGIIFTKFELSQAIRS